MLMQLLAALVLVALSVVVHALILTRLFVQINKSPLLEISRFWPCTFFLIRIAYWAILAHVIEMSLWAVFYHLWDIMPDIETSFYFSVMTYTTIGYGDIVPPTHWRLLAGVEGLTGILMCGWSTAFFFAIVGRMYQTAMDSDSQSEGRLES